MKNENGITLVELLAALAIVGIITAVIASVLSTGTSSADRTASKQQLQQEANYIVEKIRSEYLDKGNNEIRMKIKKKNLEEEELWMNDEMISQGYIYNIEDPEYHGNCEKPDESKTEFCIYPPDTVKFIMVLKEGEELEFPIETTFSKLR